MAEEESFFTNLIRPLQRAKIERERERENFILYTVTERERERWVLYTVGWWGKKRELTGKTALGSTNFGDGRLG